MSWGKEPGEKTEEIKAIALGVIATVLTDPA